VCIANCEDSDHKIVWEKINTKSKKEKTNFNGTLPGVKPRKGGKE
jgi:hypothetical protein